MKRDSVGLVLILLFYIIYFFPSTAKADSGNDFLKKCAALKNENPNKTWHKFRAGKEKFNASRKKMPLKNIKKKDVFNKAYCLGYITASANALGIFLPMRF